MSEKKASNNGIVEDLTSIGLIFGGIVIGNLIDVGAQKILKLDKNVSLSGIEEMKKFISPAVKIIGGGAGAYFIPNKTARLLLGGVAVSGASSVVNYGIKKVIDKTSANVAGIGEIDYSSVDNYNENMVLENYNPSFPELSIEGVSEGEMEIVDDSMPIQNTVLSSEEEDFEDAEIM